MDDFSFSILKAYQSRKILSLQQLSAVLNLDWRQLVEAITFLRKQGYLRINHEYVITNEMQQDSVISIDTPIEITYAGESAFSIEQQARKHLKFNEIRAWTTAIVAAAAFIKSFFF
jgi:predicted transcriptional regulator of viral defense system